MARTSWNRGAVAWASPYRIQRSRNVSRAERHRLAFDVAVCSEELGCSKRNPASFLAVCERLDRPAAGVLYVGDNPTSDVDGARRAGLSSVWLDHGRYDWPSSVPPPPERVETLGQIPELLGL